MINFSPHINRLPHQLSQEHFNMNLIYRVFNIWGFLNILKTLARQCIWTCQSHMPHISLCVSVCKPDLHRNDWSPIWQSSEKSQNFKEKKYFNYSNFEYHFALINLIFVFNFLVFLCIHPEHSLKHWNFGMTGIYLPWNILNICVVIFVRRYKYLIVIR